MRVVARGSACHGSLARALAHSVRTFAREYCANSTTNLSKRGAYVARWTDQKLFKSRV